MAGVGQDAVFLDGEGDAWFERNRAHLNAFNAKTDQPLEMLRRFGVKPRRVLELGCSNGARLAWLRDEWGAEVVGSDVSAAAVADGRERYGLDLRHGPAGAGVGESGFDLVVLSFVLHWVEREKLDAVLAAVDAALAKDGLVMLGDFAADQDQDVLYHHYGPGDVFTYKRDYARLLSDRLGLRLVGALTGGHANFGPRVGVESHERIGFWLLER